MARRNSPRRASSEYSSANMLLPVDLISFCGLPVRSAVPRSAQNRNRRELSISDRPPM